MWEPFNGVLEPKQLHDGNIWHPVVIHDFQLTFEIWSHKCGANSMMGLHIPIQCIQCLSITLYMFKVDVGIIPCGMRASTTA